MKMEAAIYSETSGLPFYMASYSTRLQGHLFFCYSVRMLGELRVLGYATWFQTTELRRNVRSVFVSRRKKFETIVFSKVFTLRSLVLVACTIRGISGRHLAARPFRCVSAVLQSVFIRTQTHICPFFLPLTENHVCINIFCDVCTESLTCREVTLRWVSSRSQSCIKSLCDICFLNLTPSTYSV